MGDDRDRNDRPSWSEIDKLRDGTRSGRERRPRGAADEARARAASEQYVKEVDKLFSKEKGGAEAEALAGAVRDAHGSPELGPACSAYVAALGTPRDPGLLSIFLDSDDAEIMVPALERLLELHEAGELEVGAGLRSQLRILAQSFDDGVAGAAEDLLERL